MKLYRYMSFNEFHKYSAGLEITGKKFFRAATDNTGVCFLAEETRTDTGYTLSPVDCYTFLSGIVSNDVLVEFETDAQVRQSFGFYRELQDDFEVMEAEGYCVDSYSRDTFRATAYCVDFTPTADNYKLGRKVKWYSL